MYSNERHFGAIQNMPTSGAGSDENESKVEQTSTEQASLGQALAEQVSEDQVSADQNQAEPASTEQLSQDAAEISTPEETSEPEEPIVNSNPNIRSIEFKDTIASKHAEAAAKSEINVVNANGIVSGEKLVNSTWRTTAFSLLAVSVILAFALIWAIIKISGLAKEHHELAKTNSSISANLNVLYEKLGASNQEEAAFAASFGDTIDGEDLNTLREALYEQLGEYTIDFDQTDFNSAQRVDSYRVVKLAINGKKYITFAKKDNVWTVLEFDETLHDRCEGYTSEARLVVDKLLSCKE